MSGGQGTQWGGTAQPTTAPPGVTYHRLSASEHEWIFDELITPAAA